MKKKRWLSILLSLCLLLTLVPTQALAEEGPEGTESACTRAADCPAQVHEPDCPLWQEDSTGPEETGPEKTGTDETSPEEPEAPSEPEEIGPGETVPDETGLDESAPGETSPDEPEEPGEPEENQPTALEQLLALAATLPDPAEVMADNADEVTAQLQAFTQLYADLTADEQESDEAYAALARVMALKSALDALTGEDSSQATLAETATGVEYIDATYDAATDVTYTPTKTGDNVTVTVVDENTTEWALGNAGETTWYVVKGTVTTSTRITVTGDVHLILTNNCKLDAQAGIQVAEGNSLTIYAQTEGGAVDDTTGQLTVTATGTNNAGIGGNGDIGSDGESNGPITIYGGIVEADGTGTGAGLGGGGSNNATAGNGTNIAIYGGQVTATGTTSGMSGSAGIGGGGGSTAGKGEAITIYGGTVEATGGDNSAGIGGGGTGNAAYAGSGSKITIHGGKVTANGGDYGAGIGGGYYGAGSTIEITGGEVTANGGNSAAGIGGGCRGAGSGITISGGTVKASSGTNTSSGQGAGIGSGYHGEGSTIKITGGTVEAISYNKGAGIGSGNQGAGSDITITGGDVTATSKKCGAGIGGGNESASGTNSITISGGTVTATSEVGGAGIGGGNNSGITNTVSITGGFVTATGGVAEGRFAAGAAIGSGGGYGNSPSPGTETTFTSDENSTNAVVLTKPGTATTTTGTVYGSCTLAEDITLSNDTTLTVPDGTSLTIAASLTMTNDGTITIDAGGTVTIEATGTLVNNGTINNNGAIINKGTFTDNGTFNGNAVNNGIAYEAYEDGQFVTRKVYDYTVVTDSMTAWGGTEEGEYWYVVNSEAANNLTIANRITVSGDVHLILADGAKLTASKGIGVNTASNSLTIYGQTEGTGELTTGTPDSNYAGIGGYGTSSANPATSGPITIHGGTVTATGGDWGAGIGGGYYGSSTVTINGGTVNATGGTNAAAIGGGLKATGTVTINGGTVNATGSSNSAGIGGGMWGAVNVTINGGTVNATGGTLAAAIGNGVPNKGQTNTGTVIINGGFVAATGGSYSPAIGIGGNIQSAGVETDTSNFNNAVVLRQSGAETTMTGQVYGSYTLTANATVPAGAALTIPENTSLTVGKGTTLTNSGAICMEGGSLQYGDPNYGTLTNGDNGKLYYLLTVEGGSATAGTATYNGKTYAEEKATVTLTAEDQVGLAFKDWTASPTSANVTFSKVDENDETNQNYQFTMPAQVLTVTAGYKNAPTYTVTIPATVSIGDTATAAIEATGVNVAEGYNLNVTLTATSGEDDAFTLALSGHPDVTLGYTMTLTKTTVKLGTGEDAQETTATPNSVVTVSENPTVLTIPGGTADSSGTAELTFAMVSGQLKQYSGTYTGTVTFSVSVTEDEAPDDSDNPGDSGNTGGDSGNTTDTTGENP